MKTIKATSNKSNKTFTLRTYYNGILTAKYRTIKFSLYEFQELENNACNDWKEFLKTTQDYFNVN